MKVNCPFQLKGSVPTCKKITNKLWTLEVCNGEQNHDPSPVASSHAAHQQLLPDQVKEIQKLSKAKLKPSQILLQLQTSNKENLATNKTITNKLQKICLQDLGGRTPIKALMSILNESNWACNIKLNSSGKILNLFFAHPGSIHLARINHHVALLDATYKTNQYKLPLLHVIGQAASNQLFLIAFCFLDFEDEENYEWAVNNLKTLIWRPKKTPKVFITDCETALRNALANVFPGLQAHLCTWHLNKNITTNCKKHFTGGSSEDSWEQFLTLWKMVTYSKTSNQYYDNFENLKTFLSTRPGVLEYITNSIIPVKELFVAAWASQHPHLRNLSRVELGHTYLKFFLKNSTGNLLLVFKSLALAVDAQINHVHESIRKDTIKLLVDVPKCFIPVLGKISSFAIQQCLIQFNCLSSKNQTKTCSQTLLRGVGIPCSHWLADILESGNCLMPDDFHLQWHLKYNPKSTVSSLFFVCFLIKILIIYFSC
jgi:alpha-glucosidase